MALVDGLREAAGVVEVGMRGFSPQQVRDLGKGEATGDAVVETGPGLEALEALKRAVLAIDQGVVALVHVRGDEVGALSIGGSDDEDGHAHHVGGEAGGDEVALVRGARDENLAAQVAALLLGGELVLEVDASGAGLDEGLHDLEAVERAPKPASASATMGTYQSRVTCPSLTSISSARRRVRLMRRQSSGAALEG